MDELFPLQEETEIISLEEMFEAYCKMDPISSSRNLQLIPLTQSDKWLIMTRVLNNVEVTYTDTGLAFFKFRKRALSFEEYLTYLEDLADEKNLDLEDLKYKMQTSGKPAPEVVLKMHK